MESITVIDTNLNRGYDFTCIIEDNEIIRSEFELLENGDF